MHDKIMDHGNLYKYAAYFLITTLSISTSFAQTRNRQIRLSGPQEGFYEKAEYIVDSSFTVDSGKTMSIAAGSVIRFRKYAQAVIAGTLECMGTSEETIVFTSELQRAGETPSPFDWNGIFLPDSVSKIDLNYTVIAYSTFGLKVASSRARVQLHNMIFMSNGTEDFTIEDKAATLSEGAPFDFPPFQNTTATVINPAKKSFRIVWNPRTALRVSLGTMVAVSLASAAYEYTVASKYARLSNLERSDMVNEYKRKYTSATTGEILGLIGAAAAAAGLTLTFYF